MCMRARALRCVYTILLLYSIIKTYKDCSYCEIVQSPRFITTYEIHRIAHFTMFRSVSSFCYITIDATARLLTWLTMPYYRCVTRNRPDQPYTGKEDNPMTDSSIVTPEHASEQTVLRLLPPDDPAGPPSQPAPTAPERWAALTIVAALPEHLFGVYRAAMLTTLAQLTNDVAAEGYCGRFHYTVPFDDVMDASAFIDGSLQSLREMGIELTLQPDSSPAPKLTVSKGGQS